jgi:integral membrane sensor domain MASE1
MDHRPSAFVSNALATLTLVPAMVMIGTSSYTHLRTTRRSRYLEGGLLAVGALAIVNLLSAWYGHTPLGTLGLAYALLPLLFWAAIRFGPPSVSLLQLVRHGRDSLDDAELAAIFAGRCALASDAARRAERIVARALRGYL